MLSDDGVSVAVAIDHEPELLTAILKTSRNVLLVGNRARNAKKRDSQHFFAELKQQVNLPGLTEPTHQEIVFDAGDTEPLVRRISAVLRYAYDAICLHAGAVPERVALSHPVGWAAPNSPRSSPRRTSRASRA